MKKPRYTAAADYAAAIRDNAHDFDLGRITVTQFNMRNDLFWAAIPLSKTVEEVRAILSPETLAVAGE